MRAGGLKHKITFQSKSNTKNAFGELMNDYSKVTDAYASITPVSGSEKFLSSQNTATTTHKITCRYDSRINPSLRILFGIRTFDILSSINLFEKNKEIQILAKEQL